MMSTILRITPPKPLGLMIPAFMKNVYENEGVNERNIRKIAKGVIRIPFSLTWWKTGSNSHIKRVFGIDE